jgi:hypothetical protein
MTRIFLSSAAVAAMLPLTAQPVPAQYYNPKEFPIHFDNAPKQLKKAQQPGALSGRRPQGLKNKHKGDIEILSISPGAGSSASRKRQLQTR